MKVEIHLGSIYMCFKTAWNSLGLCIYMVSTLKWGQKVPVWGFGLWHFGQYPGSEDVKFKKKNRNKISKSLQD